MSCCPKCGPTLPTPSVARYGLTKREADALGFIKAHIAEKGFAPSYEEIGWHLSIVRSNVHRLVSALEERGHLRRLHNRGRCIEVIS